LSATATIPKPKAKKPEVTDANALEVVSVGIVVADCVARPVLKNPEPGRLELVDSIGLYSGGSAASTGLSVSMVSVISWSTRRNVTVRTRAC
jgi:hypothetical protein